jgi:hypothetical protein
MSISQVEMTPIKVHITQDDTKQPAVKTKRQRVSIPNSYPMNAGALPVQIAPDAPGRCRLAILVNGAGANPPVIALAQSESDAQAAQANAIGQFTGNVAYVTGPNTIIDLSGTTAWWAVLITAGTNPCVVSTIAEIDQ